MPKLTVNGNEVEFDNGMTVLQACELAGEEIPRFCYHERLSIAGNCRMCLVQIEGGPPKPAASCAMPAADGMVVHTNTPMVKKAREGVMEFLLINHPLDCPICDQGGECDLQDQAMTYGLGSNRYDENKRAVPDKYMGPLVKTHMTRCIHCTRCVRFSVDVAGVEELGAIGRGEHMEITTYLDKSLSSELSGNVIDLCPVGALTSRPYAFAARPWELRKIESIDVMDALGSNIRVDVRGKQVMRILPRINEDINEEWISDKTRFACDGLRVQRLDRPYIRKNGTLQESSWDEAIGVVTEKIKELDSKEIAAVAGDTIDCESMVAFKILLDKLNIVNRDCRQDGAQIDVKNRASYLFNSTIAGIDEADACLIIGSNPRLEAPVLNARIRKRYLQNKMPIAALGNVGDLTYPFINLGDDPKALEKLTSSTNEVFKMFKKAEKPMIIVGASVWAREDGAAIMALLSELADKTGVVGSKDWNGFNVLHHAAARVGGLDVGFVPGNKGKATNDIIKGCESGDIKLLYLLAADELPLDKMNNAFVVYQGHHGDAGAHHADVVLPGAAYTEKDATYVNTEGRVQQTRLAIFPPGEAKQDWQIIQMLSEALGKDLGLLSLQDVRDYMVKEMPHLQEIGEIVPAKWRALGKSGKVGKEPLRSAVENFYQTDPISRASKTMARCTAEKLVDADLDEEAA